HDGLPMGFIPRVFFPDQTARSIGWPTGSPFQFEVGLHDGAWGVLGFLSSGSAACSGSPPGLAGRCSCLTPPTAISARCSRATTTLRTTSSLTGSLASGCSFSFISTDGLAASRRAERRPNGRALTRVATGAAIPDILPQGGWRQARSSPTGSGPEGSSPNEIDAGCLFSLPPASSVLRHCRAWLGNPLPLPPNREATSARFVPGVMGCECEFVH